MITIQNLSYTKLRFMSGKTEECAKNFSKPTIIYTTDASGIFYYIYS